MILYYRFVKLGPSLFVMCWYKVGGHWEGYYEKVEISVGDLRK